MSARFAQGDAESRPDQKSEARTDWSALPRLWPYLWEFRTRVLIALGLLLAAKLASVTLPLFLKWIVDALDSEPGKVLYLPLALLLGYGGLRLANVLFGELRDMVFVRVTQHSMRRVALQVFEHVHKLDLSYHLERRTGGLSRDIERGLGGIRFIQRFMLFNIVPTLVEITLVAIILWAGYSIWYALITVVAVGSYIGFSVLATEWRTGFVRKANTLDSGANTRAIDALLNYETVKYFNNEQWEANRYDKALSEWESASMKASYSLGGLNSGQALIIAIAVTAMMTLAANDVVAGDMTIGDLVLINAYILQLFIPLNFLGFIYREIKSSLANMARMFSILDQQPAISSASGAADLKLQGGALSFDQVSFAYRPERPILKDVSFSVPAGSSVAIVGPSGAGKSTIARLLFRFYDADQGAITIDGQSIRDCQLESVRKAIAVVPQDTVLFNDSIYYNIQYGRPDASKEEVLEAAKLAHLDGFITDLPDGYDTVVGERGLKLSGGEKQRIAIARAILKRPCILVFDEATSSLDSATEQAILAAMREVAKNRTSVTIAHRLSTIVDADQIIVLEGGAVVETGSHQQLLARKGVYANLWALQQQEQQIQATEQGQAGQKP